MEKVIAAIIFGTITAACFVLAVLQFKGKGFLFNNAYIYATKEERYHMNKKPYYTQSGIVFVLIGFVFLINTINALLNIKWLIYLIIAVLVIALLYAVISSVVIEKNKK